MTFAKKRTRKFYDSEISSNASVWKEPGEKVDVYGPFDINGKKYATAAYYPSRKYHWRFVRNFLPVMLSMFWKPLYFRQKNLDELLRGVRVYDPMKNPVSFNKRLYLEAYRTTRIWLRVYFNPFYPPFTKPYETKLRQVKRIAENLRRAGYPEPKTKIEASYVDELRRANQQVYQHMEILERHNKMLIGIVNSFNGIWDRYSTAQTKELYLQATRFKSVLEEMAVWCEDRAKSWNDFVDAFNGYREARADRMTPMKKYAPRAIFDGTIGVLFVIASGGSIAMGTGFTIASDFGFQYLRDIMMRPKWQANMLTRAAALYRATISRIDSFLELYSANPTEKVYRISLQ